MTKLDLIPWSRSSTVRVLVYLTAVAVFVAFASASGAASTANGTPAAQACSGSSICESNTAFDNELVLRHIDNQTETPNRTEPSKTYSQPKNSSINTTNVSNPVRKVGNSSSYQVQLSNVTTDAASDEIKISGSFEYNDSGDRKGAWGARVQVWDSDPFDDDKLETVYVEKDGTFSATIQGTGDDFGNTLQLYLKIEPINGNVRVVNGSDPDALIAYHYWRIPGTGTVTKSLGSNWTPQYTAIGSDSMLEIMRNGMRGWHYVFGKTGDKLPTIVFFAGNPNPLNNDPGRSFYCGDSCTDGYIPDWASDLAPDYPEFSVIGDDDLWSDETQLHEYGHHVMDEGIGYIPPTESDHSYGDIISKTHAWTEGWAPFFSAVVRDDSSFENSYKKGIKNEGTIASVLWDIYDENNEDYSPLFTGIENTDGDVIKTYPEDRMSYSFSQIWDVAKSEVKTYDGNGKSNRIDTLNEFWDAWGRKYGTSNIKTVFYVHQGSGSNPPMDHNSAPNKPDVNISPDIDWYSSELTISATTTDTDGNMAMMVFQKNGKTIGVDKDGSDGWSVAFNPEKTSDSVDITATPLDHLGEGLLKRSTENIKTDVTSPNSPSPDDGITGYTNRDGIKFTWGEPADTGSGVDGYYYELNDPSPDAEYTDPSQTSFTPGVNLEDGRHTFYIQSYDGVGLTSSVASHAVKIDTVAPDTDIARGSSVWSNDDTVFIAASDEIGSSASIAPAGISRLKWKIDGGPINSVTDGNIEQQLSDGQHTIEMWATDTAGNTESHETVEVWIDTTAPGQPQLDPLSGWTDDDTPTVSWNSVTDGASGVDHYEIRVDGGSWQDVGTSTSYTLSLSSGTHTVEVRAVDQAGNTGSSDSETVRVDTQSPDTTASLSGTAGNNPWYVSTDVTVTLSADDDPAGDNSGVAETRYRVNGGTYTTGTSTTVSGDGTHTVEFYSVDTAGNTESTNTRTVKIDSTPPGTPNPNTPSSWTSDTTVSWSSVSDATSGVDHYEVRIDSGSWTSVGTSTSYDASALADGTHTIDVRAIDVAGNAGSDGSTTLKLDTTGPTSPGPVDGPTGWIADTSTSISWSSATDADSGVDHYMVQVGSGTPTNVGTSTQTTVTGLSSGENTISVWAVDNAGNTGTKATTTIKVDLNAPSLSIASPANESVTNQSSITVDGTVSDANGGVQSLEVSSNGGSYTTIATSDGSWSYTWSSLTEGENTLTLRATDTASNTRTTTLVVTSDTVAPGTPNPTGPTGWTNDSTPTVTWSAVSDTTSSVDHYEVRIDGGTWQAVATTSFTPSTALSDGTHTIDVRAVDTAQNTGSAGTVQVKVDTTAPPAPSTVSGPSGWISQSSATISWDSVTDADSGVDHYMIQVGSNSPQNVGTNTQTTLTGLQTGVNTISVWAVDTAGNAGPTETTTVKIDVTPPGLSIASPANESATNQSSITVDGSLSDPDAGVQSLEVSSNGGSYTTIATSAGSWSYTWSSLTEGENTLTLRATDTASNTQTTTLVVTSDTVAPGTPNPTGPTGWTNDSTPTVTWSAVSDTTSTVDHYEVRIDGGSWQAVTTTSFTPATALADGTHTVDVRAVDSASNTGSAGSTQLQIDTTAPPAPSSVSSPSGWISQSSATISWSGVTDAVSGVDTYEVKVDNGGWQSVGTSTSETLTGLSPGTHTIRVRARDAANNAGPAAQTTVKIDLQSPDVTNLAPSNGAIINSSAVTIQGSVSDSPAGVQVLEISEDGGNTWTTVTNSGGSWTYDWTSLSTGSQSLQIRATDAAGNTRTITYTLTVDLSGPPMPTLSAPSGWVDTAGPTVDWQPLTDSTTSLDYYEVRVDGSSWNSVSSSAFTPSLSDGTHTVEVRGVDAAGNAGPAASTTLKVDTTAPSAPSTLSGPSGWTNNTAPTLSWASVTDSTSHIDHYEMRADGGSWVDVGMSTSAAHPDPFADGTHTVGVRAVDAAGNAGASVSTTLKIDTTLPSARVLEPTSGDVVKNSSTMVTGTASDSPAGISAVRVSPDNGTTWTTVATTSGNWTYQWTNLTGAKIFLQIEVVDLAGNVNRSTFSLNRLFATPITMPNGMAIGPPEDLNGDDVYKDIDGNGARCPTDVDKLRMIVKAYQGDMRGPALDLNQLEIDALDVDGDGKLTMDDVQALERQIGRSGGRQCLGA